MPIERHEQRVRKKFELDDRDNALPWQFHLKTSCLCNMRKDHTETFLKKKFSNKLASKVQEGVAKFKLDGSSSEESDDGN